MIKYINLPNDLDALVLYRKMQSRYRNIALLESMDPPSKFAKQSILCFEPLHMIKIIDSKMYIDDSLVTSGYQNIMDSLRKLIAKYKIMNSEKTFFLGGLLGFTSYDFINYFEKVISSDKPDSGFPDAQYGLYLDGIIFDHFRNKTWYFHHYQFQSRHSEIIQFVDQASEGFDDTDELIVKNIEPLVSKNEFEESVKAIKQLIINGETFQTVLSQILTFEMEGNRFDLYHKLREINPSPYMYILEFDAICVIGSSPELLISQENDLLVTYPIAGTRPVGTNFEEFYRYSQDLISDEKELAEHNMLVDLARNDIGKIAQTGSVDVSGYLKIEAFSHVIHLVSKVEAIIQDGKDMFDSFLATFPAGTVSGAPKIRSMQIIDRLEKQRRGPYAGSVGYFDFAGNMVQAIAIRSAFGIGKKFKIQAGAGIVLDSDPETEFYETLSKLAAFLEILAVQDSVIGG